MLEIPLCKRRGRRKSCWRVVGCPCCRSHACARVSGLARALPVWPRGTWPCGVRHGLGHPARRHAALPRGACPCLLLSVHRFVVCSPRWKLCSVFLAELTDESEQQKCQRNQCPTFGVLKLGFLQIFQFLGVINLLLQKIVGLLPLMFSSQAGISFEMLPSCFKQDSAY